MYAILATDTDDRAWSYEYTRELGWRWRLTTFENDVEFEFEPFVEPPHPAIRYTDNRFPPGQADEGIT
jgi:hypothetical protein